MVRPHPPTTTCWYDCIASYACMGTLFTILLTFLRRSDHTATSTTSRILRFFVATFLQLVLHVGLGHQYIISVTLYLGDHFHTLLSISYLCLRNAHFPCFCVFLRLLCVFMISIISYIRSSSRTFTTSDQSPNQFISASSCVPAVQHYCSHQLQGSPKHINPGTSNMETDSNPTSYSFHPRALVISSKNNETRSNMFYLIKLIVFADGTCDYRVCTFSFTSFYLYFHSITIAVKIAPR